MKMIQFTYPFKNIVLPAGTVRQIGFEFPQSLPIEETKNLENNLFTFYNTYRVKGNDTLEFDNLNYKLLNSNLQSPKYKYAIIDILYDEEA